MLSSGTTHCFMQEKIKTNQCGMGIFILLCISWTYFSIRSHFLQLGHMKFPNPFFKKSISKWKNFRNGLYIIFMFVVIISLVTGTLL